MARKTIRKKPKKLDNAINDKTCHTMKIRHHIWNREHHVGPILTTKGKSGPNPTISMSDCIGKGEKGETKAKANTWGRGKMGLGHHKRGKLTPTRGKHL